MGKPKKRKGKIHIKQKAAIVRKDSVRSDSVRNDTLPKAPTRVPNNGATFKVKIRKRNG